MATRRASSQRERDPEPARLTVRRTALAEQLADRIKLGRELLGFEPVTDEDLEAVQAQYYSWDEFNTTLLRNSFTTAEESRNYVSLVGIGWSDDSPTRYRQILESIKGSVRRLESVKERLSLFDEMPSIRAPRPEDEISLPDREPAIFLVHGRAEGPKHEVARFVRGLTGTEPIILAEQANLGQTVIEKFEKYASLVSFAIVLVTGDDEGRLKDTREMKPRARQNVILELGWFAGKLGRNRVAMLYEPGVELPSDMVGVLYAELDSGEGWKLRLARELKAAHFPVNMNEVL